MERLIEAKANVNAEVRAVLGFRFRDLGDFRGLGGLGVLGFRVLGLGDLGVLGFRI